MDNILIAHNNRADGATLSGGAWDSTLILNNLKNSNISKLARADGYFKNQTRFRADLTAAYSLRAVALVNHNLGSAGRWRVRVGNAPLDVDFTTGSQGDDRLTTSGGVNGTRITSAGLVAAATCPRIDYDASTLACKGLLVEEQRTNLFLRSSELGNAVWNSFGVTVTSNTQVSPSGATDADELAFAAAGDQLPQFNISVTSGATYTMSAWVKLLSGNGAFMFKLYDGATDQTGATHTATSSWVRVSHTFTAGATSAAGNGGPLKATAAGTIAMWGLQCEAGDFATSYIPTTSAQVTRTADSASITSTNFSGFYNATAGTLYVQGALEGLSASQNQALASLNDTSANEEIVLARSYVANDPQVIIFDGGALQAAISAGGTFAAGTYYRSAAAFAANDIAICRDGGSVVTDTSATLPTVTRLQIGAGVYSSGAALNGHIKRLTYWRSRLTNAQLQSITTSGPDALGHDSGWVDAYRLTWRGDAPSDKGAKYALIEAFDAITARYLTVEFDDEAAANFVTVGRLFVGGGFQPANNASYGGYKDGRTDLSTASMSVSGKKYATALRRPCNVKFSLDWLTQAEADQWHELMDEVGTTGEVLYVPDPADMAHSQRYGMLGYLSELGPLDYPLYNTRATAVGIEEKL